MRLYLAQLVHELQLVDANVPCPVARRQMLSVRGDADTSDAVTLVVHRLATRLGGLGLLAVVRRGVGLLDVTQLAVDVNGLQELVAVDVSSGTEIGFF